MLSRDPLPLIELNAFIISESATELDLIKDGFSILLLGFSNLAYVMFS